MIIMAGSFYFLKPSEAELKKEKLKAHADSVKAGKIATDAKNAIKFADTAKQKTNKKVDSAILKSPFGAATVGEDKLITLQNSDIIDWYKQNIKQEFSHLPSQPPIHPPPPKL